MKTINFFVSGVPKPAGSKNAFAIRRKGVPTGQVVVTDSSGKSGKQWRNAVAAAARQEAREVRLAEPLTGPVSTTFLFVMPRAASHYRTGKRAHVLRDDAPTEHTKAPDTIKLTRSAEDALKGILWVDDAQVIHTVVSKRYAMPFEETGVYISVSERQSVVAAEVAA